MKNKLKDIVLLGSKFLLIVMLGVCQGGMLSAQPVERSAIEEALNSDGTLRQGVSGSFNASGYQMSTNASGEPIFTPIVQSTPNTWNADFAVPYNGMNAAVSAIETDGNGTWYFGGNFTQAGGLLANRVVKYDATVNALSTLGVGANNGTNDRINEMKLLSGFLYVAGDFTTAGGITANRIARYNPTTDTWSAVGSGGGNGVNGEVLTLSATGITLYVGGNFSQANVGSSAITANGIASWNGSVWSSLGTGANNGVTGGVSAIASTTNSVFVGGPFTAAGTTSNQFIARFDLALNTWNAVGAGTGGQVTALTLSGSDLYAGGFFTTAGGSPASRIARWNGTAWSALGAGLNDAVGRIIVAGSQIYVSGIFTQAGGNPANRIARWNGTAWSALGGGLNSNVGDIRLIGDTLYVVGAFTTANGNPANRIARYRPSIAQWSAVSFLNGVNGTVRAVSVLGNNVYLGGSFTVAGGVQANRVARYNITSKTWSALGSGVNDNVNAIVAFNLLGDAVYVGGSFTQAGGAPANRLARWFNNAWTTVGTSGGNGVNAVVTSLAYRSGTLYVGGGFTQGNVGASPVTVNRIARVNTTANSWSAVGSGGDGVDNTVHALWISESGDVFVGGDFTNANVGASQINANRVARWDGNSWSSLGTGTSNGASATVLTITGSASDIYIGGTFSNAGGVANTSRCARWSTTLQRWISMNMLPNAQVNALAVSGSYVFAGGQFTQLGSNPVNRIARWNGATWTNVGASGGEGADDIIRALAVRVGRELVVGGQFTQVNVGSPISSRSIARWTADTSARAFGPNITFNYTITTPGATPTITFTNSTPSFSAPPTGISAVSQYFWTITPNATVFTQGFVEFDVFSLAGVTGNPSALRVLWRPNASTAWTNLGGSVAPGNMLQNVSPLTEGGQIAIGDNGGGNQLPVELTHFAATLHKDGVLLNWTTNTELNNAGFFIERRPKQLGSTPHERWQSLDFVKGNGTTASQNTYAFIDKSAAGMVEYRLKQVDFNGIFEYSPMIEINAGLPKSFDLSQNYPNPFNPTTTIQYQLPTASIVRLELYDVLGKKVATLVNEQQEAGVFVYQLDAAKLNLASGAYFYRLQAGGKSGGTSFMKTKKMLLVK
ncbi:MAG: T9SS type A sorting domain-containing protein [Chloroherpetonaceae bacterium]